MHDRLRTLVRGHERVARLQCQPHGTLYREGAVLLEHLTETPSLDELHEEVDQPGLDVLLVGGEPDDVLRVGAEALHDLRLAQEALAHLLGLGAGQAVDAQDLERLDPPTLDVLHLVHGPERTGTEPLEHAPLVAQQRPYQGVLGLLGRLRFRLVSRHFG